jgi:hypothetical protein
VKTVIDLYNKAIPLNKGDLFVVVADVAFAWKWWLLSMSRTGAGEPLNKNVGMVLGFWHSYYHACRTTWKYFRVITEPAFKSLFPEAPWYDTPKLYQIVRMYTYMLVSFDLIYDEFKAKVDANPTHRGIQYFWDFFNIVLPIMTDYSLALKAQSVTRARHALVGIQILFEYCHNTTYAPAIVMQLLHLAYWQDNKHPMFDMILHHMAG